MLNKSRILDEKFKNEVISWYEYLSENSKKDIKNILEYERKILIDCLSNLKNEDDMSFVKVKEFIERKMLQEIRKEEQLEEENKVSINNLLLELELA